MPDVNDRDGKEAKVIKVLAREFNRARLQLLGLIQELDPWMVDVAPEFWQDHITNLNAGLSPALSNIYQEQAQTMLNEFDFLGLEWGLVNEAAADWAKQYTFGLVTDITDTSRRTLQKLIPQYFENQWTQGQLREQLQPTYGALRAEMIARTEVTRAASEGEQETARQLSQQGITMQPIWQTRRDEIVCPICGPLQNVKIGVDEVEGVVIEFFPPAHPRCRCWVIHEIVSE